MKRMLFIYNPASGKGQMRQKLSAVLERFTQAGWLVTTYPTQCKADATRVARELGEGYDRVVCAGGDGTLSETVTGLMELPNPPVLGFIPSGSTNDCAHNLRLPAGIERAAMTAADGFPLPVDVGRLNGKPFVYVAAFGAFTEVAYDTPQELKNTFGHLAYVMAGIGQLPNLTPYRLRVEYEGGVIEDEFLYGMVCNTYSVAGVKALPKDRVALDDGLFEVLLVRKDVKLTDITNALQALLRNAPVQTAAVVSFETSKVTITCDKPIPWTIDGEYGGTHAVTQVENCRRALTVVHGK